MGVKSLRRSLMDASTSILPFSDASTIAGATTEAFGQAEPLTRRLAHILQLYPEVRQRVKGGGRDGRHGR